MSKPVLVLGGGGHATALLDILRQLEHDILGVVSIGPPQPQPVFTGLDWYTSDDYILSFDTQEIRLVNALGALPGHSSRYKLHEKFKSLGYRFLTVISPHAVVSEFAALSEGVQIMPGSFVNANAIIGEGSIVNTGAIIEHDCVIGRHNHIAPGAVLSGSVVTGDLVHIATGASVIQGITIGNAAIIGAGVSATQNIAAGKTLYAAKPFLK